ncbi:MAG: permease-like cell division protein FtsX [Mucinivorans sp.]
MQVKGLSSGHIASTTVVTLILLLLGAAGYLLLGGAQKVNTMASEMRFSLFLQDTISRAELTSIESNLRANRSVVKVDFLSKEQASSKFAAELGVESSLFEGPENPIPASFEVQVVPGSDIVATERQFSHLSGVEQVIYPHAVAKQVQSSAKQLIVFALGFGAVLLFISLVVIRNTLRLEIAAQGEPLREMIAHGVRFSAIRNPFISRALTQGALAGVLASVALFLSSDALRVALPEAYMEVGLELLMLLFAVMICTGILLCVVFTYFSINSQFKKIKRCQNQPRPMPI